MSGLQKENIISMFFIGIFSVLLLAMPYYRGLFFETDAYLFELLLGLWSITIFAIYYRTRTLIAFKDVIIYPLLFVVIIYFISSMQGLTPQLAFDDFLRWLTYGIVFTALLILVDKEKSKWVLHAIFISIIWISVFGLLAQFGLTEFKDAILGSGRIASVLQYPNTLASLVGAIIIGLLMYALRKDVKWYIRGVYLTQLVPLLVVFIFTQSRAAYLLLPIVWLLALLFLKVREQIKYVLMSIVLIGSVLPLMLIYDQYLVEGNHLILYYVFGLGLLFGCVVIGGLWLSEKVIIARKPFFSNRTPYFRIFIPVTLLVIMIIGFLLLQSTSFTSLLPETIQKRISGINLDAKSLTSRITFFEDSFDLFKDHWVIGAGGNAWKGLYHSYQSVPYTSTQTHSFLMKLLTDVGIFGSLMFLSFIGLGVYTIYRWIRKYGLSNDGLLRIGIPLIMATMIFMHSTIDFDMSYGYVSILWFTLLALVYIQVRDEDTAIKLKSKVMPKLATWVIMIPSLVFMAIIGMYTYAASINLNGISYTEALDKVNTKVSLSPSNVAYRFQKVQILELALLNAQQEKYLQEMLQELLSISELDKNNPITLLQAGQYFAKYGYGQNALTNSGRALEIAPWLLPAYEQYIFYSSQIARLQLGEGNIDGAREKLAQVQSYIEVLEEKIEYLKHTPNPSHYKQFKLNNSIRLNGGKALVLLGEFDRARAYLDPLRKNKDLQLKLESTVWVSVLEGYAGDTNRTNNLIKSGRKLDEQFDLMREEVIALMNTLQHNGK